VRVEPITGPDDPRVTEYHDVQDAERRRRQGLFVVENRTVVRLLLTASRYRARSLLVTAPALESLRDLLATLDPAPPVYLASQDTVRRIAGFNFHGGCLAIGERGTEPTMEDVLAPGGRRLVVALEELGNPDNVGGVFRNAMAFAVDAVVLSPGSVDPLYRKAIRVSVGGTLAVPFARAPVWPAALGALRRAGFALLALSTRRTAIDVAALGVASPLPERIALLLGHEGHGLAPETLAAADLEATIPMAPGVDSLNVATAAGIALHRLRASR
jgi:tRNA G18 (ribose-2'-O)-methylase SpoU